MIARLGRSVTNRVIDRKVVALAVPALGSLIVEPIYNLSDTAIVGRLGERPLGSLALASAILDVTAWTFNFLTTATTSRISYHRGAGDDALGLQAVVAAYWAAAAIGTLVACITWFLAPALATYLGDHGTFVSGTVTYLRIAAFGLPALLTSFAGIGHLQGMADTKKPLYVLSVAATVNLVAEIALVNGFSYGLAGSALGTVLAQFVAAGWLIWISRQAFKQFQPSKRNLPTQKRDAWLPTSEIRALLTSGVSLVVRTFALLIAMTAAASIAARLGTTALGGYQITVQVWILLAFIADSIALAAQVLISQATGKGRFDLARATGARCIQLSLLLGVILGGTTALFASTIPKVFSLSTQLDHSATLGLLICALAQPVASLAFVLDGLLLGARDYRALRRTMLISLAPFAAIGLAVLRFPGLGIAGVWAALSVWMAARAGILWRRWRSEAWQVV